MFMVVHNGHRNPTASARPGRAGCRAGVLRVAVLLLACLVTFLALLWATNSVDVYREVRDIVQDPGTSFKSGKGVAQFCHDLQGVGQTKRPQVLFLITSFYLFLQTFCVPGTIVLNAAVGAILGTLAGVPYCTLLGTLGASSCYLLSRTLGTSLVEAADARLMKGRGLPSIRSQVQRFRPDLFVYMLFLRLTPILPNWLVNLASPVVGVPLSVFAGATGLGIIPQTYITVRFGAIAHSLKRDDSDEDESVRIVTVWDTLLLAVIGVALLVVFRLKKKFKAGMSEAAVGDDDAKPISEKSPV